MRFRVVSTAAALLAVAPGASFALGLGDINLRSSLNAPLNADIELTASAEELASLRAQIASRETFSRYGLEYPAFLTNIQVRVDRLADGRAIIRLTSAAPMTEPFATILVEASWASGRNLREYTVLFDPPAFAPTSAAPVAQAPVAAPTAGAGDRSAAIVRPAEPNAGSQPASQVAGAGGEYVVRSGDSLSVIARNQFGRGDAEKAMVAIFRSNPGAFEGNMNRLRAGAVLRLPDGPALASVNAGEAAAEVRRQTAGWRNDATASGSQDQRLRLIPPASGGASGGNSAEAQALRDQVARLEGELAEQRRLLELRNAELAKLQNAVAPKPGASAPAPAPTPPAATTPPEATEPTVAPAVTEPAPAATEPPVAEKKPAKPAKAAKPAADSAPSVLDFLKQFWWAPLGLAGLAALVFGLRAARRRRDTTESGLAPFAVEPLQARDTSSDTFPLRKPLGDEEDPSILVEESGTHQRLPRGEARTVDLDDAATSMSVPALDATTALDQGDPLAEADFHMAYGLYDQAADLVKLAIKRDPDRRDLKLKLLEVFFVWGNKDQFLQTARELAETRDAAQPGEWEKIVIMGKQLAPEDDLFSQASGGHASSVDLNLEGGQNLIDFDLHEPSVSLTPDGGVDLDLGGNASNVDVPSDLGGLDFMLDDPSRGGDDLARTATTRQMAQPGLADFAGLDGGATQRIDIDGPTVEQPGLGDISDTLVGKIEAHGGFSGGDQTAELAIDDLGLDLGKFDATGTNTSLLDDSQLARALESSDAPTMLAGMDEPSRRLMEQAGDANQPTELLPLGGLPDDAGATSMVSALDLDFDLDANAETGKRLALGAGDAGLDLDVGLPEKPVDGEHQRTQRIEPTDLGDQDLEPVTMSEVGTKLDLARAYIDMGDPDGARSILREVLQEGSGSQRQEAQRLIDSIPG